MVPPIYHSHYSGSASSAEFAHRGMAVLTLFLVWIAPFILFRLRGKSVIMSKKIRGSHKHGANRSLNPSERKALLLYLAWVIISSILVIIVFEYVLKPY